MRPRSAGLRLAITMVLLSVTCAGCGSIKVRAGNRPDVAALESSLVPYQSTKGDVARVLGKPFGEGGARLPFQKAAHGMWSYYYEEGSISDDRRMFLFVYFDQDQRYDGYLWFSSLPQ